jgi:hypothetical protein
LTLHDFLPHVREAIHALGYVRPEYDHSLAILLDSRPGEHPHAIARFYRKLEPQIDAAKKKELGLRANTLFSVEAMQSLTDKGLKTPKHAHEVTLLRATFRYFHFQRIDAAKQLGAHQFRVSTLIDGCPACRHLNGKKLVAQRAGLAASGV